LHPQSGLLELGGEADERGFVSEPAEEVGMWCDQRWQVARHSGDEATIAELLAKLHDTGDPHWMLHEAMAAADRGDAEPSAALAPHVEALGAQWPRWAARLWQTFNAHLAVLDGDADGIADLVARLEPDAGHWAVLGGGVLVQEPVCLSLGRLEAARGRWERALAWATEAETDAQRVNARLWVLEARSDRLAPQHALGAVDDAEVVSTIASAGDRGLIPSSTAYVCSSRFRRRNPSTCSAVMETCGRWRSAASRCARRTRRASVTCRSCSPGLTSTCPPWNWPPTRS
jgi:hypothetical protein